MSETIINAVKDKYGSVATSGLSSDQKGVKTVAEAFGYTPEELASIPAEANMGLSHGNPTATANLRSGEVVVDLGSGGGLDVLLAARKVGPTGKAIGIDMTQEMIDLARRNAAKSGLGNIEFHLSIIDKLPLPDASVDCVISNCVINLAPDKPWLSRKGQKNYFAEKDATIGSSPSSEMSSSSTWSGTGSGKKVGERGSMLRLISSHYS